MAFENGATIQRSAPGVPVAGCSVDSGDRNVTAMWNRTGGSDRYAHGLDRWWMDHRGQFAAALI